MGLCNLVWSWPGAVDVTALINISAAGLKIGRVQAGHLLYCRAAAFPCSAVPHVPNRAVSAW